MRAILINPIDETIKEVFYEGNKQYSRLHWIQDTINCNTIDGVRLDEWGQYMYIDDEGMLSNMNYFFKYTNNDYYVEPVLIAGKALVVGTDHLGNDIEPELTIGDLRPRIKFLGRKALH
jgi:hypothetical protein